MNLMLADDHPLFLEGLQYLLETYGLKVTGVAENGCEALIKARALRPDIILMDIKMPSLSGTDALKLIKAELPDIKIVMLTSSEEDEDLYESIKYGASGYLLKSTNAKELVDLLTGLENGEVPISPGLATRILGELRHEHAGKETGSRESDNIQLTERQSDILEMAAKGVTYKEIGETLGLTERTVKYHMGRIIELLHMENRAQVISYAARIGLIKDNN